ncbi:dorsalin-1-like [Protopterus annectens]|uniref:dorsalin-1-like n=1 Tax=Protopterus annectens TaxID=7888 RepID=UPI001CFC30FB|nr:dorsalin-1-like [Protopterus annectens]
MDSVEMNNNRLFYLFFSTTLITAWGKPLGRRMDGAGTGQLDEYFAEQFELEEDISSFDFSAFLEIVKDVFLRSLNFSGVPPQEQKRVEPPQFMIDLYNRYASDKSSIPESNIVRSFSIKDISSTTLESKTFVHKHILTFNVSIPRYEEIILAELRLFTFCSNGRGTTKGMEGTFLINDVDSREDWKGNELELRSSPVAFKDISNKDSSWESFDVTSAIKRWVTTDKVRNKLEVQIQSKKDDVIWTCGNLCFNCSIGKSQNMPLLIVFSDDRTNGSMEGKEKLKEMIAQEEEELGQLIHSSTFRGEGNLETEESAPRIKRNAKSSHCRRTSLRVNFKDIGWDTWILAPKEYEAFACEGACYFPLTDNVTPTNHAIVQTLVNMKVPRLGVEKACCVPTKLEPISILMNEDGIPTLKYRYEGMTVAECGCR